MSITFPETVDNIVTDVQAELPSIPTARIIRRLNKELGKLSQDAPMIRRWIYLDIGVNQTEYRVPHDVIAVKRVYYRDSASSSLVPLDCCNQEYAEEALLLSVTTGNQPHYYWLMADEQGFVIKIDITPSSGSTDGYPRLEVIVSAGFQVELASGDYLPPSLGTYGSDWIVHEILAWVARDAAPEKFQTYAELAALSKIKVLQHLSGIGEEAPTTIIPLSLQRERPI